ncbi:hypothetical protein BU14_1180s0004 [Porphyra umbilicalis]|uniref:Uncharacterized protein n=1 Tax=Porphyra umbilicalis TaxID=2786 RepID=A0A1X6NM92_PORUM|nr:hypothetical protein BU14_1180s0004 [Porphyra umbilicalis]|eukprot:OSX69769.1 hypothetical protein BU14_1180s0004 [Porphyra umbilicalis]
MAPALRGVRGVDDPNVPGARDYVLVNWAVVSLPSVGGGGSSPTGPRGRPPPRPSAAFGGATWSSSRTPAGGGRRRRRWRWRGGVGRLVGGRPGGAPRQAPRRLAVRLGRVDRGALRRRGGGADASAGGYCWVEGDVRAAGVREGGGVGRLARFWAGPTGAAGRPRGGHCMATRPRRAGASATARRRRSGGHPGGVGGADGGRHGGTAACRRLTGERFGCTPEWRGRRGWQATGRQRTDTRASEQASSGWRRRRPH